MSLKTIYHSPSYFPHKWDFINFSPVGWRSDEEWRTKTNFSTEKLQDGRVFFICNHVCWVWTLVTRQQFCYLQFHPTPFVECHYSISECAFELCVEKQKKWNLNVAWEETWTRVTSFVVRKLRTCYNSSKSPSCNLKRRRWGTSRHLSRGNDGMTKRFPEYFVLVLQIPFPIWNSVIWSFNPYTANLVR